MIRRWHRWVAPVAALFILWIAATGAITQAGRIYAGAIAAPRDSALRAFVKFVTDLHSGASFGVAGELISLAAGCALLFLAASGAWMYWQMARGRLVKVRAGGHLRGGQWFWR
jgi:uncharacterized iron-regulated membrane protein